MIANRIFYFIGGVSCLVLIPIVPVTTFLLGFVIGLLGRIPYFGALISILILLPLNLVWLVLFFPMLGLSWVCRKAPALRNVIGILFIPWVVVANTLVVLVPSMGEVESRACKIMLCEAWPFTWEFWQFLSRRFDLESADSASVALNEVVERMTRGDPIKQRFIIRQSGDTILNRGTPYLSRR